MHASFRSRHFHTRTALVACLFAAGLLLTPLTQAHPAQYPSPSGQYPYDEARFLAQFLLFHQAFARQAATFGRQHAAIRNRLPVEPRGLPAQPVTSALIAMGCHGKY